MAYPSTFADLKAEVVRSVRLHATDDDSKTGDWINQAYADTCIDTEATLAYGTATLTVGTATYALPSQILRLKEIVAKSASDTTYGGPLLETPLPDILTWRQTGSSGTPTNYALGGYNQLEFYPTPDTAGTLLFYYIALPTALAAPGDVPVLQEPFGSYCLKYGAMAEAAAFLKDPMEGEYRTLYDQWVRKYRHHLRRRQGGHTLQLHVGPAYRVARDPSTDTFAWR